MENNVREYFPFIGRHSKISEILSDKDLASLGDAYVNFVYSLALSKIAGKPIGRKIESDLLSSALKRAGIRSLLPKRMDRHKQADAAEALMVFGWLSGAISIKEMLNILVRNEDMADNLSLVLKLILERSKIS
ncbi:MAG: ribonuclease III family protein [Candidatus Bathyarchaeia archaeon]